MSVPEPRILSFVIKIWLDDTAVEDGAVSCRGQITHVPGGKRHYFDSLDGVTSIIESFLLERDGGFGTGEQA